MFGSGDTKIHLKVYLIEKLFRHVIKYARHPSFVKIYKANFLLKPILWPLTHPISGVVIASSLSSA